tara:strand:+ start:226 stop:435 length:210 start_codon:yes stop_codon:yes gene_type:complete
VRELTVASEDTLGTSFEVSGIMVPVLISQTEVSALLASYDASDASSPSEADARVIARLVLDALKSYNDG